MYCFSIMTHFLPAQLTHQKIKKVVITKSVTTTRSGAGDRTRFAFSFPLGKKIIAWFPPSREPAAVHWTTAFRWVRVRRLCTKQKREAAGLPFLIGAGDRTRFAFSFPLGKKMMERLGLALAGSAECALHLNGFESRHFLPTTKGTPLGCLLSLVPVTGLEPVRCRQRWILSPLRLPFHHTGMVLI